MASTGVKWYNRKTLNFILVSIVIAVITNYQTCNLTTQNNFIRDEQKEINHRLDVRDTYRTKGLIDGAKDRENAYYEIRTRYERILEHCKTVNCELPNDLTVIPAARKFEPLEALLIKDK